MSIHELLMRRCFELARRAEGYASPNPLVGCVVAKDGRIVGEGIHWGTGKIHAERMALFQAGAKARGASLYVNLEPCVHWGRTPPCAHLIVECGIRRVFCSVADPWYRISGRGFAFLERAKVKVYRGILEAEGKALNRAFLKWCTASRPYVMAKIATTLDGKLALRGKGRVWITSEESRADARRLRFLSDAVVVGAQTVILDNPQLTIRLNEFPEKRLFKVILDGAGRISPNMRIFEAPPVVIFTGVTVSEKWLRSIREKGAVIVQEPLTRDGKIEPDRVLEVLAGMGAGRILIEGGADVISAFLAKDLIDEMWVYMAARIFGTEGKNWTEALSVRWGQRIPVIQEVVRIGGDVKVVVQFLDGGKEKVNV